MKQEPWIKTTAGKLIRGQRVRIIEDGKTHRHVWFVKQVTGTGSATEAVLLANRDHGPCTRLSVNWPVMIPLSEDPALGGWQSPAVTNALAHFFPRPA